jgi:hypothetical protein
MYSSWTLVALAVGLFAAMLGASEVGYRIGRRAQARDGGGERAGGGAVEGAVFALLGLLLAFTFGGAASRFDTRRTLVVEEANAIGTAWLRLDLLVAEDQPPLRDLFRRYLDARIAVYQSLPDLEAAMRELGRANALQAEIWVGSVEAARRAGFRESSLLLPALNQMFDITTTRTRAAYTHVPGVIVAALFGVAVLAALLAGHGMSTAPQRNLMHAVLFAAVVATTFYLIVDFEYPRIGLLRLDAADQVLLELRDSLRQAR